MKTGWLVLGLVLASSHAFARDRAKDESEIRRVEKTLCEAFEKGDAKTLREYMDPQFTQGTSSGGIDDFKETVSEVEKRDPAYDEFRNHDQTVRVYDDSAIVIGITSVKGKSGGKQFAADFKFTDTYIYRDGHWWLAASHATKLAK
jgi:ketosteroid isomerase-like protein